MGKNKQLLIPFFLLLSLGLSAVAETKDELIQRLQEEIKQKEQELAAQKKKLKKAMRQINDLEEAQAIAQDTDEENFVHQDEDAFAWSHNMKRQTHGVLSPTSTTIPKGDFMGRFSHIARNPLEDANAAFHEIAGIEYNVEVGLMLGYGLNDRRVITLQGSGGLR